MKVLHSNQSNFDTAASMCCGACGDTWSVCCSIYKRQLSCPKTWDGH